jgi:hypothetical protein
VDVGNQSLQLQVAFNTPKGTLIKNFIEVEAHGFHI